MEIKNLSDKELLNKTSILVKEEKELTWKVLQHLQEVDRRKLFCDLGYSSLFNYCVDYLHYSEGEAHLRISSMRLMKQVPAVKNAIEQGELSLTNASLLSRHIKEQEKESGVKFTLEQKTELVKPLHNLPKRQAEKVLGNLKTNPVRPKVKIEISPETQEKLQKIKELQGFSSDDQIINQLLDQKLKELEKQKNKMEEKAKQEKTKKEKVSLESHTRYIPAAVKRAVLVAANHQCQHVSQITGKRCQEKSHLQVDHLVPYSFSGSSNKENLRILCRAHNARYAIITMGQQKMDRYLQ
ncbi:MAG: HNH endonuclease signature motif containing protein [Pseudomonadota bacterium]